MLFEVSGLVLVLHKQLLEWSEWVPNVVHAHKSKQVKQARSSTSQDGHEHAPATHLSG